MRYVKLMPKFFGLIVIFVAVLVFTAFAAISQYAGRALREQEARAVAAYHERLSAYINEHINSISNAALLSLYRNLPPLSLASVYEDIDRRTYLIRNLQLLFDMNPGIQSVCFFSGGERLVMYANANATMSILPLDTFFDRGIYDAVARRGTFSQLTGMRMLPVISRDAMRPLSQEAYVRVVSVIKRLPLRGNTLDAVVVNIGEDFFSDLLRSSNLPQSSILLITDTGGGSQIAFRQDAAYDYIGGEQFREVFALAYADGSLEKSFTYTDATGERFFVCAALQHIDRIYYMLVPERNLSATYSHVNMTMLLVELVVLGIGICLAFFLGGTVTRPLGEMMGSLEGGQTAQASRPLISYPALDKMSRQIHAMVERSREQEEILARYFRSYKENVLLSLLTGHWFDGEQEALQAAPPHCAAYLVIACCFEGQQASAQGQAAAFISRVSARLEAVGDCQSVMVSAAEAAFILSLREMDPAVYGTIQQALGEALQDKRLDCCAVFSVGKAYSTQEGLHLSYRYAKAAFDAQPAGKDAVLMGPCAANTLLPALAHINRQHDHIVDTIYEGDLERAAGHADLLFELMEKNGLSMESMRNQCKILLFNLAPARAEDEVPDMDAVAGAQTVRELHQCILAEIEKKRAALARPADAKNAELIERVKTFIVDHYQEDIALNVIADYVYFSPQYLGKLFKEIAGVTFSSYLIQVRMEAAAKLLLTTKKSVNAVSAAVGYTNVQSFSRAFKGYYDCSPGDYRKSRGALGTAPLEAEPPDAHASAGFDPAPSELWAGKREKRFK